jgi:nicotinamidase-related amidase
VRCIVSYRDAGDLDVTARRFDPASTALLICDLQNDYVHPDGAYARGGATSEAIVAVPARVKVAADAVRRAGGWIVSTQFTLVPGKGGEPLISPHLRRLRPFLRKGDFAPGSWGHDLLDTLKPADLTVEKIAQSAFYMSRLEFVLRKAAIETLAICGIATNGGVASTLRDAHGRDFSCVLLTDGCAAFDSRVHDATVAELSAIVATMTCAELASALAAP